MSTSSSSWGAGETQQWPGERQAQGYVPPQPQGLPPGFPLVVKTKPSVLRIAFGVFLGLLMFSVVWVIVSILMFGLFASAISNTINDLNDSVSTSTDDQLKDLDDLLNEN